RRADGTRRLIAHPDPSVLPSSASDTNDVASIRDPLVAAFADRVLVSSNQLQRVLGGKIVSFDALGKRYFGSVRRFEHAGDPPWAIGLLIPVDDVMAAV